MSRSATRFLNQLLYRISRTRRPKWRGSHPSQFANTRRIGVHRQ
jgi:hypothetical protein